VTKIERLKLRFASGMSEGRISDDEWLHEFLPVLEDAARWDWARSNWQNICTATGVDENGSYGVVDLFIGVGDHHPYAKGTLDAAIDVARNNTTEESA